MKRVKALLKMTHGKASIAFLSVAAVATFVAIVCRYGDYASQPTQLRGDHAAAPPDLTRPSIDPKTVLSYEGPSRGLHSKWVPDRVRIVHVVNVYPDIDEDRALVFESMHAAKAQGECVGVGSDVDVKQIAAIRPGDEALVPASFDGRFGIHKYFEDRYPVLQSIFDGALKHFEWEYMVFTNSDIVLDPLFYCTVRDIILREGHDAFTINRKTVPEDTSLEEINSGKVRDPKKHPGHDCFVMARDVWSKYSMGNTFIGWHRFSKEMVLNMLYFSKNPRMYTSFEVDHGTYHRGNKKAWKRFERGSEAERIATANIIFQLCGKENNYNLICEKPKSGTISEWCRLFRGGESHHYAKKWCKQDQRVVKSFR